jgi:hypothetical protein
MAAEQRQIEGGSAETEDGTLTVQLRSFAAEPQHR